MTHKMNRYNFKLRTLAKLFTHYAGNKYKKKELSSIFIHDKKYRIGIFYSLKH